MGEGMSYTARADLVDPYNTDNCATIFVRHVNKEDAEYDCWQASMVLVDTEVYAFEHEPAIVPNPKP